MSVVVERGLARCPRCVAVADYTFVESGPNVMRYEVRCRRCGEDYCEVHTPMAPDFTGAVEALVVRPPENISATGSFGSRIVAWSAGAQRRWSSSTAAATEALSSAVATARRHRDWPRRVRRVARNEDEAPPGTGGTSSGEWS